MENSGYRIEQRNLIKFVDTESSQQQNIDFCTTNFSNCA